MSKIDLLTVDGVVLPNPSTYDPTYADLDSSNSYTSETGILNRDMIRGNHRTIAVEWSKLKLSELQIILRSVSDDNSLKPSFQLKYFDLYSGTFKTGKFYATDRGVKSKRIRTTSDGYFALSFNFKEF